MGLFGGGNSKRTTINEDNRTINDFSGANFDNSVDSSQNFEDNSYNDNSIDNTDNSYLDSSQNFEDNSYLDSSVDNTDNSYSDSSTFVDDNSYSDSSTFVDDNSYSDSSTSISGEYAGNSGSIQITDGGAFETVQNAVTDLVSLGVRSLASADMSLETMGKTAGKAIEQASINNELMRDLTTTALEAMSEQATSTVSASTAANRDALAATSKLMTTVSANGNDLLIDGVVNIAKFIAIGLSSLGLGFVAMKFIGNKA